MPADFTGYVGKPLTFSGTGAGGDTRNIVSWEWDFGDGTTATGQTVQHTYNQPGTYTVTLTVTNDCGGQATATHTVEILTLQTLTITINAGMNNFISVPIDINPANYGLQDSEIWYFNGNTQQWEMLTTGMMKAGVGYQIVSAASKTITIEAPQFVSLTWQDVLTINRVQIGAVGKPWWFIGVGGDPISVPSGYTVYDPYTDPTFQNMQTVTVMQPGHAYWLYIPENACPMPTADFTVQPSQL